MSSKLLKPAQPLTELGLSSIESDLGVSLPVDYRRFMLTYNGGRPVPCMFDIVWLENHPLSDIWKISEISRFLSIYNEEKANFVKYNKVNFLGRIPKKTIAIAYDPGGNLVLLVITGEHAGKILFWVKDYEIEEDKVANFDNVGFIANNFDELLNSKLY